jgi:4-amino-4-deoxy-L-arabinose transferase-like glycosyltransferase
MTPPTKALLWGAVACGLIGLTLDNTRPYRGDESFYITAAIDMTRTGDLLVPRYFGEVRLQKPVVTYWLTLLGYEAFGVHLWSGRVVFLGLAGSLLALVYRLSWCLRPDAGLARLNVALLTAATLWIESARTSMTDLPLAVFTTAAMLGYCRALAAPGRARRHLGAALVATGCAVATKGPFGAIPLVAMGVHLWVSRPELVRQRWTRLVAPGAVTAFLALGFGWYAYAYMFHGPDLAAQVQSEVETTLTLNPVRALAHVAFYAGAMVILHVPAVVLATHAALRRGARLPAGFAPLVWLIVVCVLASSLFLEHHRERYLLLATPAIVIACGALIHQADLTRVARRLAAITTAVQVAVLLAYPLVVGRPLNDLVGHWQRHLQGDLATAGLTRRETSWVQALSGDRVLSGCPDAPFVLIEDVDRRLFPAHTVVRTATEFSGVDWRDGRLVTGTRTFLLLRRPQ